MRRRRPQRNLPPARVLRLPLAFPVSKQLHQVLLPRLAPSPVFLSRLEALDDLVMEMRKTFRDAEAARGWLMRPVPSLDERTPRQVIVEGASEKLTGMLIALNTGMSL